MRSRATWGVAVFLLAVVSLAACESRTESARDAAPLDSSDVARDAGVATDRPGRDLAIPRDWIAIKASDTLRVIAAYNSTTYFIYRGEPMGYEYELLKQFAADHDLVLKVIVVQNRDSMVAMLRSGQADLVANRLIPTPEDSGVVAYTRALYHANPVVVQRKAPPQAAMAKLPKPADTVLKAGPADPTDSPTPTLIRARIVQRP